MPLPVVVTTTATGDASVVVFNVVAVVVIGGGGDDVIGIRFGVLVVVATRMGMRGADAPPPPPPFLGRSDERISSLSQGSGGSRDEPFRDGWWMYQGGRCWIVSSVGAQV
jgi:hypothetical protein